jgi:hypothetical protein
MTIDKAMLKAAILADGPAAALWAAGDFYSLTNYVNAATTTKAWRASVSASDLFDNLTISSFDNATAGKRDCFRMMLDRGTVDATKKSIRDGFADIFALTGGYSDGAQLAKMLNGACVENARWAEVALGGTTPAAVGGVSALKRNFVGSLSLDEVASLQGV